MVNLPVWAYKTWPLPVENDSTLAYAKVFAEVYARVAGGFRISKKAPRAFVFGSWNAENGVISGSLNLPRIKAHMEPGGWFDAEGEYVSFWRLQPAYVPFEPIEITVVNSNGCICGYAQNRWNYRIEFEVIEVLDDRVVYRLRTNAPSYTGGVIKVFGVKTF